MREFTDERQRQLATRPVGRLLLQFATPSIIAMSASAIYNLCDSMFIGKGAGPLAIAGLALTFPLMNISSAFGAMFGVGAGAQTSVKMGEGNQTRALQIFGNMLRLDVTVGLIITIIGLLCLDPILRLFGASEATLPYARDYMQIILAGNVITHTFLGMNDQLRSTGHPREAMTAQLIAVVVNIVLDATFIFGLGWGMRGAALATVLGQLTAWCYEVRFFFDKRNFVYFSRLGLKIRLDIIREILAIGLSPFCMNLCNCLIVIILNHQLLTQGGAEGDAYVGVYGIVNRCAMFIIMMVAGFGQGLQPIVGFNIGARLFHRVVGVTRFALGCAFAVMTVGYAFVFCFPGWLSSLFANDADIIEKCIPAMRIVMCAFPLVGPQMIATSFFQSSRKAGTAIFLTMSRQLVFLLPLLLILPGRMGVEGVWWSMPISDTIAFLMAAVLLMRQMRRLRRMQTLVPES